MAPMSEWESWGRGELHPWGAAQTGDERGEYTQGIHRSKGDDTTGEKREEKLGHEGAESGV